MGGGLPGAARPPRPSWRQRRRHHDDDRVVACIVGPGVAVATPPTAKERERENEKERETERESAREIYYVRREWRQRI